MIKAEWAKIPICRWSMKYDKDDGVEFHLLEYDCAGCGKMFREIRFGREIESRGSYYPCPYCGSVRKGLTYQHITSHAPPGCLVTVEERIV